MAQFPSLSAGRLEKALRGLGYSVKSQRGSHKKLTADGRLDLMFAFHKGIEVPPGLVRKILVKDVGLTEDEALALLRGKRLK